MLIHQTETTAIATAKRLGAQVFAFDVRPVVKEQVESLGAKFIEVESDSDEGTGEGGYAKEVSDDYKKKQSMLIEEEMKKMDLVISTALIPERPAPILINAHPINSMPTKSTILPKKPLVLFASIVPLLFTAPDNDTASISSSRSFLLMFSCLFLKKLLSLEIKDLLNIFDSFVFLTISAAFFFASCNPLLKAATESLIDLILIDDFNNDSLLALIDIRQMLQMW